MFDCTKPVCEGYLRPDGRKGIRNKLLVIHTVDCSSHVAFCVADALRLQGIESEVIGQRSCFDHQGRVRALLAYCVHPNVGGVLVVAAGCENTRPDRISGFAAANGRPSRWYALNDIGGTDKGIQKGLALAAEIRAEMGARSYPRACLSCRPQHLRQMRRLRLYVGGWRATRWSAAPSTASLTPAETASSRRSTRVWGCEAFFVERGATETAKAEIAATYDKAERSCRLGGPVLHQHRQSGRRPDHHRGKESGFLGQIRQPSHTGRAEDRPTPALERPLAL